LTRFLLTRHGRSTWNAERRIQRWAAPPLNKTNQEQAHLLAKRLHNKPPIIPYTNPQKRTQETADIVGDTLSMPVVADERLKEHSIDVVTGLAPAQVDEQCSFEWTRTIRGLSVVMKKPVSKPGV
jgi:broad specificity phosphatase PhoE